jgi:oxidoreductase
MAEGGSAMLKALVIGGTGATGKHVVGYLLKNKDKVDKVMVLGRRKLEFTDELKERYGTGTAAEEESGRLVQHVEDLDAVSDDTIKNLSTGCDVFFNCLGSTRAQAGSAQAFFHIDCEIPERIAKIAKSVDVKHASVLTSWGANQNSWFLYGRTKGEIEDRTKKLGFDYVSIFQPGLLDRGADSARFVEKVFRPFMRSMAVDDLAKAMVQDAINIHTTTREGATASKTSVLENADIWRVSRGSSL